MNASTFHRFAKYHGIDLPPDDSEPSLSEIGILAGRVYPDEPRNSKRVVRLIESLTRIDDAEMLAWSQQTKAPAIRAALGTERDALLLRAGIDPIRWITVAE